MVRVPPDELLALALALTLPLFGACGPVEEATPLDDRGVIWKAGPPLPQPTTNNAVAAVATAEGVAVFSFLGLDSTKAWSGVTDAAYRWDVGSATWQTLEPVPGPARLASTAQVVDGRVYVIGGYTVAENGEERSVPDVDVYDPATGSWSRAADIPLPTDDAVAGVWRDSLIVLVSGWHDDGNVPDVQIFDPASNEWRASTPIAGTPVFGHAGGVAGDVVVYVDGVEVVDGEPRFAIHAAGWRGLLSEEAVEWRPTPPHPGPLLYRAAGGTVGTFAVFVGGTDNPYNYDGMGYDGVASEPIRQFLAYSPIANEWRQLAAPPIPSMDHRNLGVAGGSVFLVGGMHQGQQVTNQVWHASVDVLLASVF